MDESFVEADIGLNIFQKNNEARKSRFILLSFSPLTGILESMEDIDDIDELEEDIPKEQQNREVEE